MNKLHRHYGMLRTALFLLLSIVTTVRAQTSLQSGDLLAICGDSITEQKQYSVFMELYLRVCQPVELNAIQFGWSGESSWGFADRMDFDVLRFKPTVATTCYGMNDGGYAPLSDERAGQYREAMTRVVESFKAAGARVVVGSPGAVDTVTFKRNVSPEAYNKALGQLRDIAREIAQAHNCAFADVHEAMMRAMPAAKQKYGDAYHVCGGDGFHPSANGHLIMAYAFLKALGCDGNIGSISVDLAAGTATADSGHKVDQVKNGEVTITSTRYPFCFFGAPDDPNATSGIIEFFPFNDDLNRLILKVKGATSEKVRVTWGGKSREFTAAQLASGINLAAEFQENPFCEPFKAVEAAVREKQNYETGAFKGLVPSLRQIRDVDGAADAIETVAAAARSKWQTFDDKADQARVPVTHTIQIEELK